jgi:hypothetical protein
MTDQRNGFSQFYCANDDLIETDRGQHRSDLATAEPKIATADPHTFSGISASSTSLINTTCCIELAAGFNCRHNV